MNKINFPHELLSMRRPELIHESKLRGFEGTEDDTKSALLLKLLEYERIEKSIGANKKPEDYGPGSHYEQEKNQLLDYFKNPEGKIPPWREWPKPVVIRPARPVQERQSVHPEYKGKDRAWLLNKLQDIKKKKNSKKRALEEDTKGEASAHIANKKLHVSNNTE